MPRADPTRSAYCASRHLLRNLDDVAELRRNPLALPCFARCEDDGTALERVSALVHASLASCRQRAGARSHATLDRMHAALLRCDIDKQPLRVVARELGLSDRQIRRERRAAHDAFLRALREVTPGDARAVSEPVVVHDRAALRLARASQLHELGRSDVALAACDAVLGGASAEERIEALCLAADIERECGRGGAAAARLDRARAALASLGPAAPRTVALAHERVDLAAWSQRRALGDGCALALAPPIVTLHAAAADVDDEPRAALLVRALAAYAEQRWEVGDAAAGLAAVRRAWSLVGALGTARTRERLAVLIADARIAGFTGRDDYALFLAAERLATRRGHVRARVVARAERLGTEMIARGCGPLLAAVLDAYEGAQRKMMPWAIAAAALVAIQTEADEASRDAAVALAARVVPPRSALALLARVAHTSELLARGRYEEARLAAHRLRNDAVAAGNPRVRGGADRLLAHVALVQHRRRDARRHVEAAMPAIDRYGTWAARHDAQRLARHVDARDPRVYLSANIA